MILVILPRIEARVFERNVSHHQPRGVAEARTSPSTRVDDRPERSRIQTVIARIGARRGRESVQGLVNILLISPDPEDHLMLRVF